MRIQNRIFTGILTGVGVLAIAALLAPPPAALAASKATSEAPAEEPHFGMDTPDEYVVAPGDTLSQIAQDHLGSKGLWPHIAEANGIDDPTRLRVGQVLRIPKRQAEWFAE